MKENRTVGPNFKSYFYYTNKCASESNIKGIIVIATGIEGTGAVYDEVGEYLDSKGYAMYAIDELGYGKTGKVVKTTYKNWKRKDFHFASYNVHSLAYLAKKEHPNAPLYLIGNDFGAMLSLYLLREFPDVVDKIVTIGWGMPRAQDYGFLATSYLRKVLFYDSTPSKGAHFGKNKSLAIRFEKDNKYSWLSSDVGQVNKIREAGYMDTPGTVGHYFFYYWRKVRTPLLMRMKKTDRTTPMLFLSGNKDLTTLRGRKTKELANFYKMKKFTNVEARVVEGRHELLFETNRYENIDLILNWLEEKENYSQVVYEEENLAINSVKTKKETKVEQPVKEEKVIEVKEVEPVENKFLEADDDLLIRSVKYKDE